MLIFLQIVATLTAIILVVTFILWRKRLKYARSMRRMSCMMDRVGLEQNIVFQPDYNTQTILTNARIRCLQCDCVNLCEHWLAGEVNTTNFFCPNAKTFDLLKYRLKNWLTIRPTKQQPTKRSRTKTASAVPEPENL